MTSDTDRHADATAWFARLQSRNVTTAELTEFAQWRRDPANLSAYRAVEAMWDDARPLHEDADMLAALEQAKGRRKLARWWSRPLHRWLVIGGCAALAALATALIAAPWSVPTWRTSVGEQSLVRLDDGTRMQLDTDTEVTARLQRDHRLVRLRHGQAYFDVHHDTARPFVVETDGIRVTALGTRFDVDNLVDRTRVSLLQGSVRVEVVRTGATVRLMPGESVTVSGSTILPVNRGTAAELTSWREGRLTFRNTQLADAIAAMNRYTDRQIILDRTSVGSEPISGDFATDDIDGFVSAVDALFGRGAVSRPGTAS